MREKIACIYAIVNTVNGRRYIGSTSDWTVRQSGHLSMLRRGVHENSYLQHSWTKHGEKHFLLVLIERCAVAELHIREQYHLDVCQPNVYNHGTVAESPRRGMKWTDAERAKKIGREASDEAKASRRAAWKKWRESTANCPHGHPWTEENTRYVYRANGMLERRQCLTCRREMVSKKWHHYKAEREPLKPRVITADYRARLKAAWKARGGGHWKGRKFSESHKAGLRAAWILRKAKKITEAA